MPNPTETTRRAYIKYAGTIALGAGMAGCSDLVGQSGQRNSTETPGDDAYTVEMAPAGKVAFESVPERWATYYPGYADMGVALGLAEDLTGVGQPAEYYTGFYDEVPGVSIDTESLTALWSDGIDREVFYAMDNDVHLISPANMKQSFDWSDDDLTKVSERVGPFIGNRIYRRSDEWHDHRYYTLYEAFEKVAAVFQREDQYQSFKRFHDEFIDDLQSQLPPEDERPDAMLTYEGSDEPETFSPYRLADKGTNKKQWRDLGVGDALAETGIENLSTENRNELDYENLLSVDPDVLLIRGHEDKSPTEFQETVLSNMRDHPVGRKLTAVQTGRVYRGGLLWEGPIQNLFLTEQAAKQLYPDQFGTVTDDRQLFDRQRLADIVSGE